MLSALGRHAIRRYSLLSLFHINTSHCNCTLHKTLQDIEHRKITHYTEQFLSAPLSTA